MLRLFALALALLLCSCDRYPESYPPPEQRHPAAGLNPEALAAAMMIEMSSPDAPSHFVKDIYTGSEPVQWYWTRQQPTLKILAIQTQGLKLSVDFSLWEVAFKRTGPVELSFFVNGHELDKVRYDSPGSKHFEKPIPPDWLATDVESTVSMTIDKLWVSPDDGLKFGFILSRIGFVQ